MQVRVDECLLNDVRFRLLVEHYEAVYEGTDLGLNRRGAEDLAVGTCIRAFWLAQKHWRDDRKLVPKDIWAMAKVDDVLKFGLAEERDGGIYVKGAKDFFDWYHDKKQAGAIGGKKSGEIRTKQAEERSKRSRPSKQTKQTGEATNLLCSVSSSVLSCSDSVSKKKTGRTLSPEDQTWPDSDPMAKVFANLSGFPDYWAVFVREKERKVILEHMDRSNLTLPDMEQVTWELKCYMDGHKDPVKSPRGKLATFVTNYAKRKPEAAKKKSLYETYGLDKEGNPFGT